MTYYIATLARCVLVETNNEDEACKRGRSEMAKLRHDDYPFQIRRVRPATDDDLELHGRKCT